MASSGASSSPPIILVPTEILTVVNSGPAVIVKNVTEPNEPFSFSELIYSNVNVLKNEAKTLLTFHPNEWISAFRPNPKFPLFVLGDIDGFVALFMNNLATLLAVILGLRIVFEDDIIYGKIVPGVSLSMLWGNLYYVYMARKLAYKENRGDICTMPYGINTPGAFAFIFSIILPTYFGCINGGSGRDRRTCEELAWYVALASNFTTGIILLLLCVVGEFIRRNTPGVALLSSISGIGFTYLALNEYLPVAASPIVSFLPFAIVMLGYFAGVKFGPVPVAFVALVVGTILGWSTQLNQGVDVRNATSIVKPYPLAFPIQAMLSHIGEITPYLSTTIPTAISIAIGTIQCVESAKRAGDFYPTREAMFADGIGTLIASLFGSILGMTTFIGHPAFKKMGAKQAYSIANGIAFLPLCFFGINALLLSIIAIVSVNPIIIFIGLVICADTLAITPQRHYPAFLLGLMPIVADWAKGTIMNGVSGAYTNFVINDTDFTKNVTAHITGFSYRGLLNFSGGSLLQCIFLTAIFMYMIDRKFIRAAIWCLIAAFFAFFGLINAPGVGVLVKKTDDGWKFTVAYVMMAALFGCFEFAQQKHLVKQPETEPDDLSSLEWAEWNRQRLLEENNEDQYNV
ncbi:unnamed protein product [Rotaria sp. Silwood2]|nr:unnamed protein product [Rotaria sp. Silwood2]CAF2508780.1 unnamed protein product [Rotaria sp. Silwood2]CAF2901910.1 unnamed protein product [Rotaria sp. Silwood2]CAF3941709.1 unnamed protein product [Rotaria sp. Silwood2]CAF4224880.1 unnamed protein product [Rotaria sp. Silwood2]